MNGMMYLDLQASCYYLWTVTTLLLLPNSVSNSDPCPPASKIYPCWCTDFPLYYSNSSSSTETYSYWNSSSSTAPDNYWTNNNTFETTSTSYRTEETTSTSYRTEETTTETASRRRRDVSANRGSNPFLESASYYTVVTCYYTNSTHDLEEGIGGMKRRWFDKLIVSNILPAGDDTLVRFPNGWLKNTRLKELEIRNTILAGDFLHNGNPLEGQEHTIMWLSVNNCSLGGQLSYSDVGTVNTMGLNKLMRMEGVDFSGNNIVNVRSMAFRYPPANLTDVNLSRNKIRILEFQCFQYIPKLQVVDLSNNQLESIRRNVFASPAKHLYHINLSGNYLTALPNDFFVNMPVLSIVNISNNYLFSMPSAPWAAPWKQLRVIDVTGNYLPCDCSLMWLLPILSPPGTNGSSTPAPQLIPGQTVLGSCSFFKRNSYPEHHALASLTRNSLNC